MTPDTAALRALADEVAAFRRLTPNWQRFRPEAGSVLVDPDTVRALCDAADEVERLRGDRDIALGALERMHEQAKRLDERHTVCHAERDASRTAHAALVAELRAMCDETEAHAASLRTGLVPAVAAWRLRTLLAHHAPTTGATP